MAIDKEEIKSAIEHQIEMALNELDQIEYMRSEMVQKLSLLREQLACDHVFVLHAPRTDFVPYDVCNCSKCRYTTYI